MGVRTGERETEVSDEDREPQHDRLEDTITVLSFLMWYQKHSPDQQWGARKLSDVVPAACRLIGVEEERVRKIILGKGAGDDEH